MKKHPIKYIKSYGFRLWFIQIAILVLNKLNILNSFRDKKIVRKNKIVYNKITKNYKQLINKYKDKKIENKKSNKVWLYWYQGEKNAPEIVKLCIKSIKENLIDSEVIVLTKDNIEKYIKLPEYINEKYKNGKIGNAHYSDIIRVGLLKKYGGTWIDATIFITKNIKQSELEKLKTIKFKCNELTSISKGLWCCFYLSNINPKLYYFLYEFYLDYWKKEDIIIDYFLLDIAIQIAYTNFSEIKEDFNENKYNNEKIHCLCKLLNEEYDEKKYRELLKNNYFHKLTYKIALNEEKNNKKTFWGLIKNGGKE